VRSNELQATGELAGSAVGGTALFIREAHAGIAARPFGLLGPLAAPVRVIHDRVSSAAYRGVASALAAGPRVLVKLTPGNGIPAADTLRGSMALGALNGAIGDRLEETGNPLALEMSFRGSTEPATRKLAVFVHGLCETDEAWRLGRTPPYGARLHDELGYTPLYLRYNTGLRIAHNGRRLAALLEEAVRDWPVPVEEIVLVGHSMGGLVARSACHQGGEWARSVRHVFCLGSPHLGAPLEKGAHAVGYALNRLPETRAIAKVVNGRSVGIKDLRFGSCAEQDLEEVPFLDCATYYFVGATLSKSKRSVVGDLLVQFPSASGQGRKRKIPFEIDNGMHLPNATHFHLLNHPAVGDQIVKWLSVGGGCAVPDSRTLPPPPPPDGRDGRYPESSLEADGPAPPRSG
jgi:pimeloyl-ACP methyl ester carboxylesterase